jgi:hypothetical protein
MQQELTPSVTSQARIMNEEEQARIAQIEAADIVALKVNFGQIMAEIVTAHGDNVEAPLCTHSL